ncbi:cora-domain-containing protein [Metschnikowia bicuspidata]|uniref:Cora-domain-containing protein n=1 Tax=Metschnikowia bicuspidata TaxID=27322 RepID=A0A4P9ZBK0_9ASCO|nr:cora-domain-containing protein [Metschnikowia bicuspidata]
MTGDVSPFADSGPALAEGLHFSHFPSYHSLAPLTNRNLQMFLEQGAYDSRSRAIALDMDHFADPQEYGHTGHDQDRYSDYSRHSGHLLEFGELNPSLEHSSDLTSLDDVCFPDYYDQGNDNDSPERPWPDLLVLQEYIAEEIEDHQPEIKEDAENIQAVNFRVPVARHVGQTSKKSSARPVLPTGEAKPFLRPIRVEKTELVRLAQLFLRVRPKQFHLWQKSEELIIKILNNPAQRKSEGVCRYTYFREDMQGTMHSPNLSGLVNSDLTEITRDEILLSLQRLFATRTSKKHALASVKSSSDVSGMSNRPSVVNNDLPHNSIPPSTSPLTTLSSSPDPAIPPFWLDILDPLEEEMKVISKTFGLHPLTTEDIFLGEAREKVEVFNLYYFLCFTSFDVVHERRKQRAMENEKKLNKVSEYARDDSNILYFNFYRRLFGKSGEDASMVSSKHSVRSSSISHKRHVSSGELCPLNMYIIIFKHGVLTFHFSATPHPINVRRRIRMLKDHLAVSTDWICYGLIDDITDSFAPLIESIEMEVYLIEDQIMRLNSLNDTDTEEEEFDDDTELNHHKFRHSNVFYRRQRSKSVVEAPTEPRLTWRLGYRPLNSGYAGSDTKISTILKSNTKLASRLTLSSIVAWKRKGDMLRRIGECRKRVMSVMRLLQSKADVIKGFSKRFSENEAFVSLLPAESQITVKLSLRQEILMYLGDIQDHVVTMVQSLNHYEKLLARSHSNYLALLNIDMTRINNDTNDILGKVTILGTILLPINVVTGLWGMNCIVPGQEHPGLTWFYRILLGISLFSICSYIYARRVTGL